MAMLIFPWEARVRGAAPPAVGPSSALCASDVQHPPSPRPLQTVEDDCHSTFPF